MGDKFDGFSIREYTAKMRSVDVFKCWPFTSATTARDVSREEVLSWLPPMAFPSSSSSSSSSSHCNPRSDHGDARNSENLQVSAPDERGEDCSEDESAKSDDSAPPIDDGVNASNNDDEKLEMVCPVCREFNAATLTAVNAHIDGCLAQSMREERRHIRMMNLKSSKSKTPKKRSIAEIFKLGEEEQQQQQHPPQPQQQQQPQPQPQPQLQQQQQPEKEQEEEEEPQIESVLKFWPFREGADEVSITVTKFQWLSRRLEALRSKRGGGESAKSDQGEAAEEEKMEMVCPVCRDFNAATVTAVNAHIDGCLAQAVREERRQMKRSVGSKPKPKVPKKRSIAEILTVAPPMEAGKRKAIEVEEDGDKSDYGAGDSTGAAATGATASAFVSVIKSNKSTNKNRKNKKTKKGKKKTSKVEKHVDSGVSFLNSEKKAVKNKKKKKKKKKNVFNNVATGKKDAAYKRMVQTAVNSSRKLKVTVGNKMVATHEDDPSIHKKKLGLNDLSVEKKQQVKSCDSVGKQQKPVSPVHGILKNHLKHVSEKISKGCNIREGTEESHYNGQVPTLDRHVKFYGKDNILGPKKGNSFDETMFNTSSDVLGTPSVKEKSSGSDEEIASLEGNRNYDHIAVNIDRYKGEEAYPIVESKQFSSLEQVTVESSLKPCTNQEQSKLSDEKSGLLSKVAVCDSENSQFFDGENKNTLHCSSYADISRPLSAVEEEQMSSINTQMYESGSFSYSGKLSRLDGTTFQVHAVNSNENKTFMEPSSSYSASYDKGNDKPESPLSAYGGNDKSGEALGDKQLSRKFSADMIDNSFPFTAWANGSGRNSCLDPTFFGLPLNSHGELINFSSSGKVGMNEPDMSSTLQGSISGLSMNNILHQSEQENLSTNERHVVQETFPKDGFNPFTYHPTRLAVTELQCRGREDILQPNSDMYSSHHAPPLTSELNLKKNSFIEQHPHDRVRNPSGNGMISLKEGSDHITPSSSQPTVRLMGKDVPIGRSSQEMQQFSGDVWTDEESRRRNFSEYVALEHPLLGRSSKQDWVSGSLLQVPTDNVLQSAKIQNSQAFQSTILMSGSNAGFSRQFIDPQSNQLSQNGSLGVNRNASPYLNPITQKSTSYAAFNGDFPEQFIPGAKPVGLSSQSLVQPTPGNFSNSTSISNGELNGGNKNPHVSKSAFGFPFLQPAVNEQAKTSWFQRPNGSLPSWLSSSTDEMLPWTFSQQFSGVRNQSFPQNLWGNNLTTPSVNHAAEVRCPSNTLTYMGPMKTTPRSPAPVVQLPHVPVATVNSGNRNINKMADRVKLDDMNTREHHPCTNTRKRPAAYLDDSSRPMKLPNLEVQGNCRVTRLAGEKSSAELQRNTRAVELNPHMDGARSRRCQNEAQNLNPRSYPAVDSFKLDCKVTTGPVQLGPKRAKHILKSS